MPFTFVKLIPYALGLILVIGLFLYIKNLGKIECESKQKTVIIKSEQSRDRIEHENKSLERVVIIKRLNDGGWLRE